ncbi:MAG: hypothetical protein ACJA04_000634 [Cellvibrionaceae bacterium]|jgi:hypothetical protein
MLLRILMPAVAGFLFYGGWAYLVNMEFGSMAGTRAGLTQGSYSFVVTIALSALLEWLYEHLHAKPFGHWWAGAIVCLLLYTTSWGVNKFSGTANIFWTILPGAIISTVYVAFYSAILVKNKPAS